MEWYIYILVVAVGFFAGFINTLAGSGSLLSLPLLMFLGLPANTANGTNRIAILLQNIVGVASFKNQKLYSFKQDLWLSVPAIIGSIPGAFMAVDMNESVMKTTIGILLLTMFLIILFKPDSWLKGNVETQKRPTILNIIIFFFIGLYGGFIQAGVGFFLLAGLVMGAGMNLVRANAIKILIVLAYTPIALSVFIYFHQVNYLWGFILAVGNMTGAYIATKVAVNKGSRFIRYILLITLFIASIKLLGGF